jgi:hypothetical protein
MDIKLVEEYRRILFEKKIKYDMQNVNGGFSGGVDISPGQTSDVMNISIDIYGGNQTTSHPYKVPPRIKQIQQAFITARQTGDPVAGELKSELKEYYNNLRRAISLQIVRAMQQFDAQSKEAIAQAVQQINARYQE